MATRPEDELILDTPVEDPENPVDPQEDPENPEPKPEEGDEEDIVFADDTGAEKADDNDLIKHLRAEIQRRDKELAERPAPQPQKVEVGPEPTLESCEYDEDKFKAEWRGWNDRQRQAERQKSEGDKQAEAANEAFQADVQRFEGDRATLKVAGAPEAIETALASLNLVQRAVIVKASDNAATVLAALGKHPARLVEIAAIEDPIKLATAIAKMEGKIQMTKHKAPEPEEVAAGSASVRQGGDAKLEKLEKEAARTGDRSNLIAYKRNLRGRAKA